MCALTKQVIDERKFFLDFKLVNILELSPVEITFLQSLIKQAMTVAPGQVMIS